MLECTKHHHTKGELDHSDPLVHSMREEKKSRTGVSKWISSGKLNLFSDGKTALVRCVCRATTLERLREEEEEEG
jgi:hypothetical protein